MQRSRRFAPFLLSAALLLAACGGGDGDGDTSDTQAPGSSTTEAPAGGGGGGGGDAGEISSADDLLDAVERTRASDTARIDLQMGFDGGELLPAQEARQYGPIALDGSAADITADLMGETDAIRLRILDDTAWVSGQHPQIRSALPAGAEWVELTAEQLATSESFSNPGNLAFLYLVGGAEDIEVSGDTVRFTIDLDAAADKAPAELRDEVAETITFTGGNEPEVTGEAVIDDEGRLVELRVTGIQRPTEREAQGLGLGAGAQLEITFEVTIEDFDVELNIEVPDAGTVVDIREAPGVAALLEIETS